MDLRTIFALNRQIIFFVYGLTFFVLGLAIALQSRRYSQLELARSLPWLAAFGFAHGLNEWGDLFIPIQRTYLPDAALALLGAIQLALLAGSFACLFEFGLLLLRLDDRWQLLHALPALLLIGWVLISFSVLLPSAPDLLTWGREANALSRYFIALPGGLVAAWGLWRHGFPSMARLNVPHILRDLRVAGMTIGLYALFAGLIPPPIPLWPGDRLNTAAFEQTVGIPPFIFRSILGAILAMTIIRALEVFNLETERFIESMEQQQILATERDRIARELHDGVIQKVYTAGLLVDSAHKFASPDSPLAGRLEKASAVLNEAIADLRRNLSELRAAPSDLGLAEALHQLAHDPRFEPFVKVSLRVDLPHDDALAPSRADDVLAIVTEALSNAVRHSRARRVRIQVQHINARLHVTVRDDGIGLPHDVVPGSGLRNMRDRARLLNGRIDLASSPGKGTRVELDVPWRDEDDSDANTAGR